MTNPDWYDLPARTALIRRLGARMRLPNHIIDQAVRYGTTDPTKYTMREAVDAAVRAATKLARPKVAAPGKPAVPTKAVAPTRAAVLAPATAKAAPPNATPASHLPATKVDRMASWRATQTKILQAMGRIAPSSPKAGNASRSAAPAAAPPKISARMASWRATQDKILREMGRVSR